MDQLSDQQLSQLTGLGECHIHSHPKDPYGFADRLGLMTAEPVSTITSSRPLSRFEELALVDTTASNITVTLPTAVNGREFKVTKISPQHALYIVPTAPDIICGNSSGVVVYNNYTSLHFKAVIGGYILV